MLSALIVLAAAPQVLTLAQAEANTREHLPAIKVAIAQAAAAKAVRDQSFSAYMPQISGSASLNLISLSNVAQAEVAGAKFSGNPNPQTLVVGQSLTAGLSASQLIWDFGQTINKIKSADATWAAQKDNEDVVWNNVLQTTRNAYFTAQEDQELVRVAQETLDDDKQHVDEMDAFVKAGTHAVVDLVQAQQVAAAALFSFVQARGNYRAALANLQQAMGVDAPPEADVSKDEFPPVPGEDKTTDELLPEALDARWEIKNLKDQVEAQRLAILWNREDLLPSISAGASAGGTLNEYLGAIPPPTPKASLAVSLSWPFFQGGFTQAAVAQAEAVMVQLYAQLDAERQQVRNDIDVARVAIISGKEQIDSAREADRLAREQLRLATGQYQAGTGIALAVFDAQVSVTTAGGQVAQAGASLAIARAAMLRALGREKYEK
jgi:outer membrane protein